MDDVLRNVVTEVCGRDAELGAEWYELLGSAKPSAGESKWTELVARIVEVSGGSSSDLMTALVDSDPTELQTEIAAVVWPEAPTSEPEAPTSAPEVPTSAPESTAAGTAADATEEDQAAWNTYLATNAVRWDGDVQSWPAFVDWFVYYAQEQGVGKSARTFCDYATANGPREVLAQYGVQVPAAATAGTAATTTGAVSSAAAEAVESIGPDLFAEFRRQYPDLAETSDAELKAALGELLTEQPGLAASGTE